MTERDLPAPLNESDSLRAELLQSAPGPVRRAIGNLALRQSVEVASAKPIELRPYQIEAWSALHQHRFAGERTGLVQMATGLGKTTVATGDVASFEQERADLGLPRPKVLFLAHQIELIQQAKRSFSRDLPEWTSSQLSGSRRPRRDSDITFATLQSMAGQKDHYGSDAFDYVIVDESHHAMAPHFNNTIAYFEPAFRLGITATPFRHDEKDLKELFGETVYSKNLVSGIVEGWLASPNYQIVSDEILDTLIDSQFKSAKELNKALFSERRNDEVIRIIKEKQAELENPRTIIFTRDIDHAELVTSLLPEAASLHSGVEAKDRGQIISDFRAGKLPTIVTVDMFNEGVDVPEANLAVFLRTTASRTIFEQQLGRVLRKAPGKEVATVLDFVGTAERLEMLYALAEEIRLQSGSGGHTTQGEKPVATGTTDPDESPSRGHFAINFTEREIDIIRLLQRTDASEAVDAPAPVGFISMKKLAEILDRNLSNTYQTVRQMNLPTPRYISEDGSVQQHISQQDYLRLMEKYETSDEWIPMIEAARQMNRSAEYVRRIIEANELETRMIKRSSGAGKPARHIRAEDVEVILALDEPVVAPEGWVLASDLAVEYEVSPITLERRAARLGANRGKFALSPVDKKTASFISPEGAKLLRENLSSEPAKRLGRQAIQDSRGTD